MKKLFKSSIKLIIDLLAYVIALLFILLVKLLNIQNRFIDYSRFKVGEQVQIWMFDTI